MKDELEALRKEVADLRREIAALKAAGGTHYHYYPPVGPSLPAYPVSPAYPGAPWPAVSLGPISGGVAC